MYSKVLQLYWKKGWISFLLCAAAFIYLMNFTWLKWGDLIVDTGRDMYVPLELVSGKLLYRDICYVYGPFSPYFNSFLFRLFGVHVHSLILSGVITTCVVSILLYKISRLFLSIFFATFVALVFLFVFAFGYYVGYGNYNFILPYSYPSIHGIMFGLLSLYFFYLSLLKGKRKYGLFYCVSVVGTFLCRVEMGIMLLVAIMIPLIIYCVSQKEAFIKILLKLFRYLILPVSCVALAYSFFPAPLSNIVQRMFISGNFKDPFTQWLFGANDITGNISLMLKTLFYYLLFFIFFRLGGFVLAYIYRRIRRRSIKLFFSFLAAGIFIWVAFILFTRLFAGLDLQYRSLPLICVFVISVSLYKLLNNKDKLESLFIITISLFSLFLMARMLLRVWAGHYGFYILVPGIIIYYLFFFKIITGFSNSSISRVILKFGFTFIFTLFIISHLNISRFYYQARTLKVSSKRGALYFFNNEKERRLKELIDFLLDYTDKNETLVVFPEGTALNFFSARRNPLYYIAYSEVDRLKKDGIDGFISSIGDKKVDYIVLSTAEPGYGVFGQDYGQEAFKYILDNYALFKQFGPLPFTREGYSIVLLKKKI